MPFMQRARQVAAGLFQYSCILGVPSERAADALAAFRRPPIGRDREPSGVGSAASKADRADDSRAATDREVAGLVDMGTIAAG